MSARTLKIAARRRDPRMSIEDRITLMLIADRTDRRGRFRSFDDEKLYRQLAAEITAVLARLRGDNEFVFGVDNERVGRVFDAMKDAEEELARFPEKPKH